MAEFRQDPPPRRVLVRRAGTTVPAFVPPTPPPTITTGKRRFRRPPKFFADLDELVRKVVLPIINDLQRGKANNTYEISLTPSSTTTVIPDVEMSTPDSEAFLIPKTATAAAAVGSATGVHAVCGDGSVTLTHDSNAATDRTFGVVILG